MWNNKEERELNRKIEAQFLLPPSPKEVIKIRIMLNQVETWIHEGELDLAEKHWNLISDECKKNSQLTVK